MVAKKNSGNEDLLGIVALGGIVTSVVEALKNASVEAENARLQTQAAHYRNQATLLDELYRDLLRRHQTLREHYQVIREANLEMRRQLDHHQAALASTNNQCGQLMKEKAELAKKVAELEEKLKEKGK